MDGAGSEPAIGASVFGGGAGAGSAGASDGAAAVSVVGAFVLGGGGSGWLAAQLSCVMNA